MTTNEELVTVLKNAPEDKETLLQLWQQVYKLGVKKGLAFAQERIERDDVEQIAFLALYPAIAAYSPEKGCTFLTVYILYIKQQIYRALELHGCPIRVPRWEIVRILKYNRFIATYLNEHGKEPTPEEIKKGTGFSIDVQENIKHSRLIYYGTGSLNEPTPGEEDGEEVLYKLPDSSNIEDRVIDDYFHGEMKKEVERFLKSLPEDVEQFTRLRFMNGLTVKATGEVMGLTLTKAQSKEISCKARFKKYRKKGDGELQRFLPEKALSIAYGGSVFAFQRTGYSPTERAVFSYVK